MQMAIANPLGLAVGSLLPVIVISNKQGIHRIDAYLGSQVALALVALVAAFFMQSRPPTAPSATANYKPRNANLGRDLKALFRNFGFLALCNIFSLSVGAFTALLTLMEQILSPRGYSVSDAGRMSAVIILSGIVGCGAQPFCASPSPSSFHSFHHIVCM
jgi:Na+/melibiose symporter-like transporter